MFPRGRALCKLRRGQLFRVCPLCQRHQPRPWATCAVDHPVFGSPLPLLMRVLFCALPLPVCLKTNFIIFFCLCLSPVVASAPLHCSSASSTPIEQSPSHAPLASANESQRRLLGNGVAQPTGLQTLRKSLSLIHS